MPAPFIGKARQPTRGAPPQDALEGEEGVPDPVKEARMTAAVRAHALQVETERSLDFAVVQCVTANMRLPASV